jgi:hypothetical protein
MGKVRGPLVMDEFCLSGEGWSGQQACTNAGFVSARIMEDVPFREMPNDGIIGLGLEGLSTGPRFNFLKNMMLQSNLKHRFALFLAADGSGGEISFGGYDRRHLAEKLSWVPVANPEQGYWQVSILSITVGDEMLYDCRAGDCKGVVDMGSSNFGVPETMVPSFQAALGASEKHGGFLASGHACQSADLKIDLGNTMLTLQAEDYAGPDCVPQVGPLQGGPMGGGLFLFGEPILRKYYTTFDWDQMRIGFGKAKALLADGSIVVDDDDDDDLQPQTRAILKPKIGAEQPPQETRTIVLLQVKFQRAKVSI